MTAAAAPRAPIQEFLRALPAALRGRIVRDEPLWNHTTLRVGGPADLYLRVERADDLAEAAAAAQAVGISWFVLGGGSNVCISDRGIRGLVLHNACREAAMGRIARADCGYEFMQLFRDSLRAGLSGLEFAVGIPGTVGGALVSNAGAYRQNICDIVREIEVVERGVRKTVGPEWMEFSYRDSRLRRDRSRPAVLVRVTLELAPRPRGEILARARENQRQRIFKQPWHPSAGSFFKNVMSRTLLERLPDLPEPLREAGVVPAGYLSAACGCRGLAVGGARISLRHGNFVVNRGGATAEDIWKLTRIVKERVRERFGVELEEEVLFVGDWPAQAGAE